MTRFQRRCIVVLVSGAAAVMAAAVATDAMAAADDEVGQGSWPSVSVNVTVRNGVLTAEGRAMGSAGRAGNPVLWRTPIARGVRATSVQHGGTTTFVQTTRGRFVIDNSTGRAFELAPNQVWQRSPIGEPVIVTGNQRPVRTGTEAPPSSATQPAAPRGTSPGAATTGNAYAADGESTSGLFSGSDANGGDGSPGKHGSELHGLSKYQIALRELMVANNVLITRLDRVQRLSAVGSRDVPTAQREAEQARQAVAAAQRRVNALSPHETGSAKDASAEPARTRAVAEPLSSTMTPRQYADLRAAQQRALDLSASMNRKAMWLDALYSLGEITPCQYEIERKTIAAYQREVERANLRVEEILLEANQPEAMSPQARRQSEQAERQVIAMQSRIRELERQLRGVERRQSQGHADEADVERAQAALTEAYHQLADASSKLATIRRDAEASAAKTTETEAEPVRARETATQPAEE
ncbi:MAG: hypothetical protein FWE88_05445 [Phycisphaerae bacterium]|nr:hypothetical protein [Phycisphaerae bacterium]